MSVYTLRRLAHVPGNIRAIVGWDAQLATFYTQVWQVPRRDADLPPLPGCDPPLVAAALRTCARQTLAAIWDCFATRGMTTRAIPKALAIYLDDRIAYRAARAAGS